MNIEPLEPRIAPASVLTYTDLDGDLVKITSSHGDLNTPGVATFSLPSGHRQLQLLTLTDPAFDDTNIVTTVIKSETGDGLVNIGRINATGNDLGSVLIRGDLGSILAGDSDAATGPGLKLLQVRSMGIYGTATQAPGGDLSSVIEGSIGTVRIAGDLLGSIGARSFSNSDGNISKVMIGGSLDGSASFGLLFSTGNMNSVTIRGDISGSDSSSGQVNCNGTLGSFTLGGSLVGGGAFFAGSISSGAAGSIRIGGDLLGGAAPATGTIFVTGKVDHLLVGGSIVGGDGDQSFTANSDPVKGQIIALGDIGSLTIRHDLVGTLGVGTASVQSLKHIGSVTIGGSVVGGSGEQSAQVTATSGIGSVKVGHDVRGGAGNSSGRFVTPGSLGPVTIGGSMVGGDGNDSGNIVATGDMGVVKIAGDVSGAKGTSSGQIVADDVLASVSIGGSLIGGSGTYSGTIGGGTFDGTAGDTFGLGPVNIDGDLIGGTGSDSARIGAGGDLASLRVAGSIVGLGPGSGQVFAVGKIGAVFIGRDLVGGSIGPSDPSLSFTGYIQGDVIASVYVGGSIRTGADASASGSLFFNGSIRAAHDIGSIVVKGSLLGTVHSDGDASDGSDTPVVISARGQQDLSGSATVDLAIRSLTVSGRVAFTNILAGYDTNLAPVNANASIGPVMVHADWIASNLVAGVRNVGADNAAGGTGANTDNVNFGDTHDRAIGVRTLVARIASALIGGPVAGTSTSDDHFGFVAQAIGSFKADGYRAPLTSGNDLIPVLVPTFDVVIKEI